MQESPPTSLHKPSGGLRFLLDVLLYVPSRAAPALTSAVILIAATVALQPSEVGSYGLAIASVLLLASMAGAWIDHSALKHYPIHRARGDEASFVAAHSRLILYVALGTLVGSLLLATLLIFLGQPAAIIAPCAILIPASTLFTSAQTMLMVRRDLFAYSLVEVARSGLTLVGSMFALFYFQTGVTGLLWAAAGATAWVLPFVVRRAKLAPLSDVGMLDYRRAAVRYGLPLMGWMIGSQILAVSDRYVVEFLRGPTEVGIYHANYQLIPGLLTLALAPLLLASHSMILRSAADAPEQSEEIIKRFTRYFLHIAGPIMLALLCVSKPITDSLVGPAFRSGYLVAPLVVIGLLGWNLGAYGQKRFEIAGETRQMLAIIAVCGALNLTLTFALVGAYGYIGAAAATLVSYWAYPILVYVWNGSPVKWRVPWRAAFNVAIALTLGLLVASIISARISGGLAGVISSTTAGAFAYAVCIIVGGDLRKELSTGWKLIRRRTGENQ